MAILLRRGIIPVVSVVTHQVTLDVVGSKTYASNSVSVNYSGITVGSGSNRGLVLTLVFGSSTLTAPTGVSATWDSGGANQVMTQLGISNFQKVTCALFGLANPVSGNKTLAISWTNSQNDVFVDAVSFYGVDQTGGASSFPNYNSASSSATVTITSANSDIVIACQGSPSSLGTNTGTLIYDDHASGSQINGMAEYAAGAGSVAIGSDTAGFMVAGVDVKAA